MARVNQALTVLLDPRRRAQYDRDGTVHVPFTDEQRAEQVVMSALNALLVASLNSEVPINIASRLVAGTKAATADMKKSIAELETTVANLETYVGEVEVTEGQNLFEGLVQSHLQGARDQLAQVKEDLRLMPLVEKIVQRYRSGVVELPEGSWPWAQERSKGPRRLRKGQKAKRYR
jgi:hypothetical protein